jgi:hypothetical protein
LRKEERNDWCSSPNIIRLIKCGKMAWAGHAALTGRCDVRTEFRWRILKDRDYLEALVVDGMSWA